MFAVVKSGGRQFKASLGDVLTLEKIEGQVGDKVELQVLLVGDGSKADSKSATKVTGEIIGQKKGDKVMTLKKRRRHNSRRRRGHRQNLTVVQIVEFGSEKLAADKKKTLKVKTAPAPKAKKAAAEKPAKASKAAAPKKPAAKKEAAEKPAAKKPAAKKTAKKAE